MHNIVATGTGFVLIDSRWTVDHGYETAVYECDHRGQIKSCGDLEVTWYDTEEEMRKGHESMIEKWRGR